MVFFVSNENETFKVSKQLANLSNLYKSFTEDDPDDEAELRFPLLNVNTETLTFVIDYCSLYLESPMKSIPKPLKNDSLSDLISGSYFKFINNKSQHQIFNIIMAANYMDIKPLLELGCAKIASQIKGKTTEEIRDEFNIKNDFTPEEEEAIKKENMWICD